jgi:membrane protease YdiL (CAAX protease family)
MELPSLPDPPPGTRAPRRWSTSLRTLSLLLPGIAMVFGAVLLVRKGVVPMVDALWHPGPAWLSVVRRLGIFVAAPGAYWAYVRMFERRPASELHVRPLQALLGGAGGAAMIGLPLVALFAAGAYQAVLFRGASPALWSVAALILFAAMLEELVYRALVLRILERVLGTGVALPLQALLFALPHLENLSRGSGYEVAALLASCVVLGLLWGTLYVLSRNLWVPVAHHAAWNFTIMLSGLPLSGIEDWRALAPLESRQVGPAWMTGGQFGPEGSLLVIATSALAVGWLLRIASRRGRLVERQA